MIALVTGGSGSGKSALAEQLAVGLGGALFYVATMPVRTDEDRKKVARHQTLRAGRGFVTLERPERLEPLPPDGATVLLECLSTLTANRMFSGETCADWTEQLWTELQPLLERAGHTVFVSAEVCGDGTVYGAETEAYRRTLTALNRRLADRAELVVEAVCGLPVLWKGSLPC